jgi:hypothetical protein
MALVSMPNDLLQRSSSDSQLPTMKSEERFLSKPQIRYVNVTVDSKT